ncbi:MAG: GvpL/GvpF family gas vesicle protein [Rhodothermales bacterium]|nr:GvpL/GvpF family gas vesicle protein [Rhodothermales bacterium]
MKGNPAESNAKLSGAKNALKEKLMNAVLQQAIQEMGSPQTIADSLVDDASHTPEFEQAAKSLFQRLVAEIEARSMSSLSDSTVAAEAIFENIRDRSNLIPDAVSNIRLKLIDAIHARSMEQMSDPTKLSSEVFDSIDKDRSELVEATARLRTQILDDITSRAAESVADFDAVAAELSNRIGAETTIVDPIVGKLRDLLLSRIEERAMDAISDAEEIARSIADNVPQDNNNIVRAADALRTNLINQVESRAIDSVSDANAVADEIHGNFDAVPNEVENAATKLQTKLVSDIREHGLGSIADPQHAAAEARKSIKDDDGRLVAAQTELATRLFEEVTNSAISELSEKVDDASAFDVDTLSTASERSGDVNGGFSKDNVIEEWPTSQDLEALNTSSDFSDQQWSNDFDAWAEKGESDSSNENSPATESEGAKFASPNSPVSGWETVESDDIDDTIDIEPVESEEAVITGDDSVGIIEQPFDSVLSADTPADVEAAIQGKSSLIEAAVPLGSEAQSDDGEDALYVYGILSEGSVPTDDDLPSTGIDANRSVEIVGYGSLRAAVSFVPVAEFSGDTFKVKLQDKEWLKEKVKLHSAVLESLNTDRTIIPMRFCTVYRNEKEVIQLLERNEDHYQTVLQKIEGKQEWSVRIYRDEEKLAAKVAESDRLVESSLGSISIGVVDFVKEEMERLNKIDGEQAIELMSQHCSSRSHASLMECATDGLFKPSMDDRGQSKDNIVLNAAYLVPIEKQDLLRDEISRLGSEYSELGFRFEIHGPWPPYHFVGEPSNAERTVSA